VGGRTKLWAQEKRNTEQGNGEVDRKGPVEKKPNEKKREKKKKKTKGGRGGKWAER